jgi:hypothetical protein
VFVHPFYSSCTFLQNIDDLHIFSFIYINAIKNYFTPFSETFCEKCKFLPKFVQFDQFYHSSFEIIYVLFFFCFFFVLFLKSKTIILFMFNFVNILVKIVTKSYCRYFGQNVSKISKFYSPSPPPKIHICIFNSCLQSGIKYFLIALFNIHDKGYKGCTKVNF